MLNESEHPDPKKFETLLSETLPTIARPDEAHYELDELNRLAEARRAQGETWEMPAHLSRCSLCLAAFQTILEGVSALSNRALKRFVAIRNHNTTSAPNVVVFPSPWNLGIRIAALAAVLVLTVGLFLHFNSNRQTVAQVSGGSLALPNGQRLPLGAGIPSGVVLTVTEATHTQFADGSQVDLAKDTQVSFQESRHGETTIALTSGKVTASVAKQLPGNHFTVTTPLGAVTVVGTRFSVTCQSEDVVVYQSTAGETGAKQQTDVVRAMRVAVAAGVVRVQRQQEQVSLTANQTAVLRENEPGIEVVKEKQ